MATGEKQIFLGIRQTRKHNCFICGKYIKEPLAWCFAHICNKHCHPKQRLNKRNIKLVCSIADHKNLDILTANIGKHRLNEMLNNGENLNKILKEGIKEFKHKFIK